MLWVGLALTLLYTVLFTLFLLVKPGTAAQVRAVDDVANALGPLLILPWCLGPLLHGRRRRPATEALSASLRWGLVLLGLGPLTFVVGQSVWAYEEIVRHDLTPFPSWADAGYLAFYPLVLVGIIVLPAQRLSWSARLGVVLDGIMTMVAIGVYSWYFVLGPTILRSQQTAGAKAVAGAYPLGDVALVLCVLLLWLRLRSRSLRLAVVVLSAGIGILAVVNGLYDVQLLQGTYATGEIIDPAWALGYMLTGLGAYQLQNVMCTAHGWSLTSTRSASTAMDRVPLWWSVLPYFLLPCVGLLALCARPLPGHSGLRTGVDAGSVVLVVLVLWRQVLMLRENGGFYRRLNVAFTVQGHDLARRVAELDWLREISQRLTGACTLDEMLDVVYDGIHDGLHYDRISIQLFHHEQDLFEERRGTDDRGRKRCPTDRTLPLGPESPIRLFPPLAALLHGEDYYYTANASGETPPDLRYLLDGTPAQRLAVPLRARATIIGLIQVDNLFSQRPIGAADAGPLIALANHVGTVVENARLHERERSERARLEALLQSAHALNSTLDDGQVLSELARHLVTALGATNAAFTHVDLEARTCRSLVHYAVPGAAPLFDADPWESLDDYPELEAVLRTRSPFMGQIDDPAFPANERAYLQRHGLHAELMVPLIERDHSSGVLEIHWDRRVEITPDLVALCVAIAEQAAVALENARLYADAAARAERDALTGLLNHRATLAALDHALLHARPAAPCAVLLLDVDNFKLFNDTYGHAVGDAVLLRVAEALRAACREDDAAGRYGGDEFALVLRGASAAEAEAVGQRVRAAVAEQPYSTEAGELIPLAVSVGAGVAPRDGTRRPEVLAVADAAMYAAKRAARRPAAAPEVGRVRGAADLLGDSPFGVLEGLVAAVDAKDRYTRDHSEHVAALALQLAEALGLSAEERRALALAGPLHDVGKIAVPDRILRKPGKLTAEEYQALQRHVTYGAAIVRGVLDDETVVEAIAYHHERWDGCGYPAALRGSATPLLGRIMQVADAVSAMLLDRPYRQGMSWERVIAELRAGAGSQFDPALVEPFIAAVALRVYPAAS